MRLLGFHVVIRWSRKKKEFLQITGIISQIIKLSASQEASQAVNIQHIGILTQLFGCKTLTVEEQDSSSNTQQRLTFWHLNLAFKF